MAEVSTTQVIQVNLTLTEKEAVWLKELRQNPFWCSLADEPKDERAMRQELFTALRGALRRP